MVNHWAIAIGINHYQFLQPLKFAQQDAQALCECLVSEAGFLPNRCILFTDSSPSVTGRSTYPSRGNLEGWLDYFGRELIQPGDLVWVFFSGYGVCWKGEDYLLPIEADPVDIASMGVPVRSLFDSLKALPTQEILVLMDINHSQAAFSGEKVGVHIAELARETRISTVLASKPEQFSHEASELGHGLFTAALLEGLRAHQCSTLANLEEFLKSRLPELCEHNDRPAQDPVIALASLDQLNLVITPVNWTEAELWTSPGEASPSEANPFMLEGSLFDSDDDALKSSQPIHYDVLESNSFEVPDDDARRSSQPNPYELSSDYSQPVAPFIEFEPLLPNESNSDVPVDDTDHPSVAPVPQIPKPVSTPGVDPLRETDAEDQMFWERLLFGGGAILLLLLGGVFVRNWSTFWGQKAATNSQPIVPPSEVVRTPKPSLAIVPNSTKPPINKPTPTAPIAAPKDSQTILNEARGLIKPVSASEASKAIERASQIPATDPLYAQAQVDIDRWSRNILEIAKTRAADRSYKQAIAAAQLVPKGRPQVSAEAQKAIADWQKRLR